MLCFECSKVADAMAVHNEPSKANLDACIVSGLTFLWHHVYG